MDKTAGLAALLGELMNQRQDGIAHDVGLAAEMLEVERLGVAEPGDFPGRRFGDHAAARLGPGQRHLDLDAARDEGLVGEDLPHPRRAEGVAEQDRVQHRGGALEGGHEWLLRRQQFQAA